MSVSVKIDLVLRCQHQIDTLLDRDDDDEEHLTVGRVMILSIRGERQRNFEGSQRLGEVCEI